MSGQILESNSSSWMTRKQRACLDNWLYSSGEALFPSLLGVKCTSMTLFSLSLPLFPASIHQSCNPVVFAEWIRMCPWQRMKEKSTGIKFQCNCLLNCGLQLLKFYPWFCVTTAVMNSVWLWFSHWRHAHFELEKRWVGGGDWDWGLDLGEWRWGADRVKAKDPMLRLRRGTHADTPFLLPDPLTLGIYSKTAPLNTRKNAFNRAHFMYF